MTFGTYLDAGNATCGGFAGSLGYEEIDAKDFVDGGVDYLKLDGCNVYNDTGLDSVETFEKIYGHWHEIFSAMDNPVIFSESAPAYFCDAEDLTDWYNVMDWIPGFGELARHSWDIQTFFGSEDADTWSSIMANYGAHVLLARYQKPGYYNDPDYIINWPGLSLDEKRSQFALWCAFSAPLILSVHVPDLTDEELEYLTHKDLIAIDQDEKAEQATLVSQDGTWDVLTKSLANGDRIVAAFNRGEEPASQTISAARLGLPEGTYEVTDLWTGEKTEVSEVETGEVAKHGTAIFRIVTGDVETIPTGMFFNTASILCLDATDLKNATNIKTTNCTAEDPQVWQVRGDGTIRSLADTEACLGEADGKVESAACEGGEAQQWAYELHGYVTNVGSGNCLTEGEGGVTVEECGGKDNAQVFALPAGVKVN